MRIAATSDLHGHLPVVPNCDVLVIAGDIGPPTKAYHYDPVRRQAWLREEFLPWCQAQPAGQVVFIAGNHDIGIQKEGISGITTFPRVHYLQDSGVTIRGVRFWGSPWTPTFNNWAFMDDDDELANKWLKIPHDTDVLITHGPPYGRADQNQGGEHCGSRSLMQWRTEATRLPRMHFFGHIHEGAGQQGHRWANVSFVNEYYVPANSVRVFTL